MVELTYKKTEADLASIGSSPEAEALAARLFEFTRADRYIARNKVVNSYDAPFDMAATAARLGVDIARKPAAELRGEGELHFDMQTQRYVVQLSDELLPGYPAEEFVFGHEVGHIFVFEYFYRHGGRAAINGYRARERQDPRFRTRLETFCDHFAGKMTEWS